jgi:hypothetical protein
VVVHERHDRHALAQDADSWRAGRHPLASPLIPCARQTLADGTPDGAAWRDQ